MGKTPLSILEFGFIKPPRLHAYQTINAVLNEVSVYEELGYERYWLSEHYSPEFAWFSPEMLLPLLAGYSSTIKIGWAGALIRYHSPLSLANNFKILSAIYNNRIDLGIAAATISPQASHHLSDINSDNWPLKIKTLVSFLRDIKDENLKTDKLSIPPHGTELPSLWTLATSGKAVQETVDNNMNLSLSFMHPGSNYTANVDTIKRFKELYFQKYDSLPITSVLVCCVHTLENRVVKLLRNRYTIEGFGNVFGNQDCIMSTLEMLRKTLENDEFVLYNPFCDRDKRMESYAAIIS